MAWPLLLIPNALNILWLGPVTTAVQHWCRVTCGRPHASFLLINNFIGLGVGPLLMGALRTPARTFGDDALRYAAVSCLAFTCWPLMLMAAGASATIGSKTLSKAKMNAS